jgi:hypothetical protein
MLMEEIEIGCPFLPYFLIALFPNKNSIQRLTLGITNFYQLFILFITEIALKKLMGLTCWFWNNTS